ncbi:MAG: hypothetical protein IKR85_03640 [Clostridia bacterium]|nr:hypothetical protein [Clostridia bacterium]
MKQTRSGIRLISLILAFGVLITAVTYAGSIYVSGRKWLNNEQNTRISAARKTTLQGTIYDSAGTALAESYTAGERHYISDDAARLALAHTIGDQYGQSAGGAESRFATTLLGMTDLTRTELTISAITGSDPVGYDIVLTVNAELCKYAASLFPKGKTGALVLINYKTGAILAKVSLPAFDPANIEASVADTAYYDRVLQYRYAPGSTFKTVTLISALQNLPGVENETFDCEGTWQFADYTLKCAGSQAHGEMNLVRAFAESCNITFARLAYRMGAEKLKATAESFGFNRTFSFDDVRLNPSYCLNGASTAGEVLQAGFGQGTTQATPLHMAMISGAIANGGEMMEPKIIREIRRHQSGAISTMQSEVFLRAADEDTCLKAAKYMYEAVRSGTGTRAKISGYTDGYVCGKTGSAESTNDKSAETDAWYTGFIYGDEAHPYAIAVVIEKGGSGGQTAAPIAAAVMKKAMELSVY